MKTSALVLAAVLLHAGAAGQAPAPGQAEPARLFAVVYERGPAWVKAQPVTAQPGAREHVAYFRQLGDRLVGAGPFRSQPDEPLAGLIVFRAAGEEEARAWLAKDPFIASGAVTGRVVEWMAGRVASHPR